MKTPSRITADRMRREATKMLDDSTTTLLLVMRGQRRKKMPYRNDILDDIIDYRLWAEAVIDGRYEHAYEIQCSLDTIARETLPDFTYNAIEELIVRDTTLD